MTNDATPPAASQPSDAAVSASYQVLARVLSTESQMIWARTMAFIAVNGGAIAALQALHGALHPILAVLLPGLGAVYAYLWHLTLKRAWAYHDMYIAQMRAHETALHLGPLGTYTAGRDPAEQPQGGLGGLSARGFANVTTTLVIVTYVALAWISTDESLPNIRRREVLRWSSVAHDHSTMGL